MSAIHPKYNLKHKSYITVSSLYILFMLILNKAHAAAPNIECGGDSSISQNAALPGCINSSTDVTQAGKTFIRSGLPNLINLSIFILAVISMIFLVRGGIMFVTSLGNEEKVKTAQKMMIAAVIGLFIATMAVIIVTVVTSINIDPSQKV